MSDPSNVRAAIDRINSRLCELYAAGDSDGIASKFAEDCWQLPPHADPLIGREALRTFWEQAFQWGSWRFTLESQDLAVADRIAVERGKYTLRFAAGSASPPTVPSFEDHGNYVVMWRLDPDGRWRAVWDAPVSTVPLPAGGAEAR
ncbi:MAG TPA: nuclear transport factor 2 family protein [Gemmatimonadaceae bacterium]|nr:nuclear transport factor 2 family protein [Gemmatimonadaceae bacterium]